jgi:hypothetical protein
VPQRARLEPLIGEVQHAVSAEGAELRSSERSMHRTVAPRMCPVGSIVVTVILRAGDELYQNLDAAWPHPPAVKWPAET